MLDFLFFAVNVIDTGIIQLHRDFGVKTSAKRVDFQ